MKDKGNTNAALPTITKPNIIALKAMGFLGLHHRGNKFSSALTEQQQISFKELFLCRIFQIKKKAPTFYHRQQIQVNNNTLVQQ